MASIFFVGNVGRDPESQYTPTGSMVTKFSVADNEGYGDKKITSWFNCSVWGEFAGKNIRSMVEKGTLIAIDGVLSIREWTDKDGNKHTSNDVKVHEWKVVGKRKARDEQGEEGEASPFDEGRSE